MSFAVWWPSGEPEFEALVTEATEYYRHEQAGLGSSSPLLLPPNVARRLMAEGTPPFAPIIRSDSATDLTVTANDRTVNVRLFVPPRVCAVYLHIHGGGWTLGSAGYQDPRLWDFARDAEVAVVSVEYRLAPEHPHPAGLEDCLAAASWLIDSSRREFNTDRLLLGGESAGAHLAALTLIALRDRGALNSFVGANLVFGIYDLSLTPSQRLWGHEPLILSTPILRASYERFTPGVTEEERRDPSISPLYADLSDLPPALFTVGANDPLIDDSLFMANRWRASGNDVALDIYPGAAHGFVAHPIALAKVAHGRTVDWIRTLQGPAAVA